MTEPALRTWAEVSLSKLRNNYAAIQQAVGEEVAIAPVVKADAYGHGAIQVSRALEGYGTRWLAVSCVGEGVALRQAGVHARILVMGGLFPFEREAARGYSLTPVLHSLTELSDWDQSGEPLDVHFDLNTGMSRLGADATASEIITSFRSLQRVRVEGLMSHFASAEDFTSPQTKEQMDRFATVRDGLREAGLAPDMEHISSTNGFAYSREGVSLSMVRPGLAIYGYLSPAREGPAACVSVQPVLTWYARLLSVREIPEGTPVGYMARFRAPKAMRTGTVAVGYADGIPHQLSTRGSLDSNGRQLPILGAVSMDLTTVDLTHAPDLQPGDAVSVLGPGMDAQQMATLSGEIPYSILCGIGKRVSRIYLD